MPNNPITLVDYNNDYSLQICIKPAIFPDSSGNFSFTANSDWGNRFFYTEQPDTISNGMPGILIHPHNRTTGPDFYVSNGIFIFSIILLFVIAGIRIFYGKAIWGLGKAVFNYQWAVKMYEEKNSLLERVYLVLDIVFLFNASLAVFLVTSFFFRGLSFPVYGQLGVSAGAVLLVFFSRVITVWFIAGITKEVKKASEFLMVTNVFYKASGILLFIPVILFNYISEPALPYLSWFTVLILFSSYMLTIIRGLYFSVKSKFYFYYYFIYLCAVEIMPLLLTTKLFMLTNSI